MPPVAPEMELVPQPRESQADFSQRVHQALGGELGTDGAQQIAFQVWEESHGIDPLVELGIRQFGHERYERKSNIPLFAEHTTRSDRTGKTTIYDRRALQAIADRCNHRIADTGDFAPLTDGHTPDRDQLARGAKHPDVLGYCGPYRLGLIGNKDPRWAIFGDEWHAHDCRDRLARLRRRSPEVWLEERMEDRILDPVAALGAETPRLDMGLTRMCRTAGGRVVEKYTASFPGPAFLPSDDLKKKHAAVAETPSETKGASMISPEDIEQIVSAIMQTEPMQWVQSQMGGGPQSLGGPADPGALAPPPPAEPAPMPGAPPMGAAPPPGGPPAGPPPGGPPAEAPKPEPKKPEDDMGPEEKAHYACMPPEQKTAYDAFRKSYAASSGTVMNEPGMHTDGSGTVDHLSRVASEGEIQARYNRLEREVQQLRVERDTQAQETKQLARYQRLSARRREFAFELDTEWERVKSYPDAAFDSHVDQTIVENYARIPLGLEIYVDPPGELASPTGDGKDKYRRDRTEMARDICLRERKNGKPGFTWAEAMDAAEKQLKSA